jgi:L,D-transpeptidase ErfK/SrfK
VRLVNQPVLVGWRDGMLYLEVHRPLAEEAHDLDAEAERALSGALERAGRTGAVEIDHATVREIAAERRGIPFPVLRGARSPEQYLAAARIVENEVPFDPAPSSREQAANDAPPRPPRLRPPGRRRYLRYCSASTYVRCPMCRMPAIRC